MPAAKMLLTGRSGAAIRDRVLLNPRADHNGLWIAPSRLAANQMVAILGRKVGATSDLSVATWPDLWIAIAESHPDTPHVLSDAGARALRSEAIRRVSESGLLSTPLELVATPGFGRRLQNAIANWTCDERIEDTEAAVQNEFWSIFLEYREMLARLDAIDEEGLSVWASKVLETSDGALPHWIHNPRFVNLLDFHLQVDSPAIRRGLRAFEETADIIRLSIAFDGNPDLLDIQVHTTRLRQSLIDDGFVEWPIADEIWRPAALQSVESTLFRDDSEDSSKFLEIEGLKIIGGPRGEGEALLIAHEVQYWIESKEVDPEEILILFRHWNDDAESLLRTLKSWGLPATSFKEGKPLATLPAVSALLSASEIPRSDGWEISNIVKLLRHGMVRPVGTKPWSSDQLASAASTVRETLVFQGKDFLRRAIDQACVRQTGDRKNSKQAALAREIVTWLIAQLEVWGQARTFEGHIAGLLTFASAIGLGKLELLVSLLRDQAFVIDRIGQGKRIWTFDEFADELRALTFELKLADEEAKPGSILLTTLDRALGVRAPFIVAAGLSEGTFPTREAVESLTDSIAVSSTYAREASRFLGLFGAADEGLILSRPTCDEKGQEILAAGFLDDLQRLFDPISFRKLAEITNRLDPAFRDRPDLAVAPADARVLAVAQAAMTRDPSDLLTLAAEPTHNRILQGTAIALDLQYHRRWSRRFDRYDGRLVSYRTAERLSKRFAPEVTFSASQLESYLYCRFQFFMNYVLEIKPVNDDDDLMENAIRRGNDLHRYLEQLESLKQGNDVDRLQLVDLVIKNEMRVELEGTSEAAQGLQSIEIARARRQLRTYAEQAADYEARGPAAPRFFEVSFGQKAGDVPPLVFGEGDEAVRLQGKIDRIDWIEFDGGLGFRVIDYKSGRSPAVKDVKAFVKLQLPLYAFAVETLGLAGDAVRLVDLAYWELREKGFKPVKIDWPSYREGLGPAVIEAVRSLRAGGFEVSSTDKNCTQFCDFSTTCRIKQVRDAGKTLEEISS